MDIDIRTLLAKLNPECKRALEKAAELCVQQTHYSVDIEHLLFKLFEAEAPDATLIFAEYEVKVDVILSQLQRALDGFKRGNGRTPALSPQLAPLFQEAWLLSSMVLGEQQIRSGTLILALLEVDSLRGAMIESAPGLLQIPRESMRKNLPDLLASSAEDAGGAQRAAPSQSHAQAPDASPRQVRPPSVERKMPRSALGPYGWPSTATNSSTSVTSPVDALTMHGFLPE